MRYTLSASRHAHSLSDLVRMARRIAVQYTRSRYGVIYALKVGCSIVAWSTKKYLVHCASASQKLKRQ
jgi:hypothetical protein